MSVFDNGKHDPLLNLVEVNKLAISNTVLYYSRHMTKTGFEDSGNILTFKVVKHLEEDDWTVLPSAYYSDDFTDKPREIDLIASKVFSVTSLLPPNHLQHRICVRLFIECKYLPHDYGFWFGGRDELRITDLLKSRVTPIGHDFKPDTWTKWHHYYDNLYFVKAHDRSNSSGSKSSGQDKDLIFNAITQVLNSSVYFRGTNVNTLATHIPGVRSYVVDYTVVLLNDLSRCRSLKLDESGHVKDGSITDNFIYEINYSYPSLKSTGGSIEYNLIDFISLPTLNTYLQAIKNDIALFREKLASP